ncbi:MAG: glycosyltransferase family 2 protein [Proteobacteria bacterium]|nr:glycosyltransferase family 2 protein [Pseudomonadota bacterium]
MNTLHSLTRAYQNNAATIEFEVIALDHGSTLPLSEAEVRAFGPEFQYRFVETKSVSPAAAINAACRSARGEQLLVIIDGAHILTPGVYALAQRAFAHFDSPFLATAPFHLGPKQQNDSVAEGYNQCTEDDLLARSGWRDNGYRLYTIAGAFADPGMAWFGCPFESSCFGIGKDEYLALGGFDERFVARGGGLVALDFFQRAVARTGGDYVMLLGEASFHQFHGGVASNTTKAAHPWKEFHDEYVRIHGKSFARVPRRPFYFGTLPNEALAAARVSAEHGLALWQKAVAAGEA